MMAPLPALASEAGLVVEEGETRKMTLAALAEPSINAWDKALRERKSPRNSSTRPRP